MPAISAVYERFVSSCETFKFPAPWDLVDARGVAFRVPPHIDDVIRGLVDEFGADVVCDAGLQRRHDGGFALAEELKTPGAVLVAVHDLAGTAISELVCSAGCLSGRPVPVVPAWDDEDVQDAQGMLEGNFFVANDLLEYIVFLSLGVPTTYYSDAVSHIRGKGLLEHWSDASWTPRNRPGSTIPIGESDSEIEVGSEETVINPSDDILDHEAIMAPYDPFVSWSLLSFNMIGLSVAPSAKFATLNQLVQMYEEMVDLNFYIWTPSEARMEELCRVLQIAGSDRLRIWLFNSLGETVSADFAKATQECEKPNQVEPALPGDLPSMLDSIHVVRTRVPGAPPQASVEEEARHLSELIYRQICRPLIDESSNEFNPAVASLKMQFAMLAQQAVYHSAEVLKMSKRGGRHAAAARQVVVEQLIPMMKTCLEQHRTIHGERESQPRRKQSVDHRRVGDNGKR